MVADSHPAGIIGGHRSGHGCAVTFNVSRCGWLARLTCWVVRTRPDVAWATPVRRLGRLTVEWQLCGQGIFTHGRCRRGTYRRRCQDPGADGRASIEPCAVAAAGRE